jgi:branched-chain amino acid transport system ATP-binding protein
MVAVLDVSKLSVFHDQLQVVWDVSLLVGEGELVAMIGPNGAGKTSLVETIFGFNRHATGSVKFLGEEILLLEPYEIVKRGLALVPEKRELFPRMSVAENLHLGAAGRSDWMESELRVHELFPLLADRKRQLAGTLSGGEQQMLAIGRGLMSRPKLLVLDEPSTGLSPLLVSQVFAALTKLKEEGMTILLLEQNVKKALELSDRAYVLEKGTVVLEGPSAALQQHEHIRAAYLGI